MNGFVCTSRGQIDIFDGDNEPIDLILANVYTARIRFCLAGLF